MRIRGAFALILIYFPIQEVFIEHLPHTSIKIDAEDTALNKKDEPLFSWSWHFSGKDRGDDFKPCLEVFFW